MTAVVGNRNKRRSESKDDDDDRRKKKRSSSRSSSRQKRKKTKQSSSRSSSRQERKKTKQSSSRSSSRQKRKKTKQTTGTTDTTESMLQKLRIKAEISPPKSLVIIWILMAAELGFDLITTGIAFVSSMAGKTECCGSNASMGPFPMATTVPFFLLIVAEITFLGRAILLTLWPRTYETSRIATHGGTDDDDDDDVEGGNKTEPKRDDNVQELYNSEIPEFNNGRNRNRNRNSKKSRGGCFCSCLKCFCSCFLRWNARMVLCILNLLTLLNPFFGCLIAWILLYQSDKTESFIVLGIESLSIILHFISVRMEGGLRTWYSKLLHSIAILPFLVTVTLVLVYIREGGVCYSVEKEMFSFSGCEICPDTLLPPDINGMCFESTSDGGGGNYTSSSIYSLAGSGGFLQDVQNLGNITGVKDIQNNFANLIDRGADQDSYCSPDTNFCFYKF